MQPKSLLLVLDDIFEDSDVVIRPGGNVEGEVLEI
jgi:hypothetical protein